MKTMLVQAADADHYVLVLMSFQSWARTRKALRTTKISYIKHWLPNVQCVDMNYSLLLIVVAFARSVKFRDLLAVMRHTTMASVLTFACAAKTNWGSVSCQRYHL